MPLLRLSNPSCSTYETVSKTFTTRPAPTGNGRQVDLNNPPSILGSVIVGDWHTHPGPPGPANPSPDDRRHARRRGICSFIIGGPFEDGEPIFITPVTN